MTTDQRLDRLTGIVETLAGAVTGHDSVIGALAGAVTAHDSVIEAHDRQLGVLIKLAKEDRVALKQLQREWQAYLNTLRRQ